MTLFRGLKILQREDIYIPKVFLLAGQHRILEVSLIDTEINNELWNNLNLGKDYHIDQEE